MWENEQIKFKKKNCSQNKNEKFEFEVPHTIIFSIN